MKRSMLPAGIRLSGWHLKHRWLGAVIVVFFVTISLSLRPSWPSSYAVDNSPNSDPLASQLVTSMCARMAAGVSYDVDSKYALVLKWLCAAFSKQLEVGGSAAVSSCIGGVTYQPIGRLGNLMGLYAIVYSFSRKHGVAGYVDPTMLRTLKSIFPGVTLQSSDAIEDWSPITYQQIDSAWSCANKSANSSEDYFWITNYPDRNGIDVFHPYYAEIRKQFRFSVELRAQAQRYLHSVRGNRKNVTYIGFHIRRTDYRDYIRRNYNMSVPEESYYIKCLEYYRSRYERPLFIVSSDDMEYVRKTFRPYNAGDIAMAGDGLQDSPGRDMAILASCNHSVVTVGTYGFWGAYLAGGTVLVPETQTHTGRGDRKTPLLEIQLAGADNWISIS